MLYFIQTFGCAQNEADSERLASALKSRGMMPAKSIKDADHIVINTCMVRQMAEDRVYGLVYNLSLQKKNTGKPQKIIITGCMAGIAIRDQSGKILRSLKEKLPEVDEFLPIEEVGFDNAPLRSDKNMALIPITSGCNNYCSFCVVPFTRGLEKSRPYKEIINECQKAARDGYKKIMLLGMNVNSYGADLFCHSGQAGYRQVPGADPVKGNNNTCHSGQAGYRLVPGADPESREYQLPNGTAVKPILVKHLGRTRIPTLFPYLLDDICKIDSINSVSFLSSNPWDFSDELIDVIAKNNKIPREIHLAVQSGSDAILKKMNRWYTKKEYLDLLQKMRKNIPGVKFSTDIIVGFCGETDEDFQETVDLAKKANFFKAYVAMYSDRPMTTAHKTMKDDIPHKIKKQRWKILEDMINKPNHP